MPDQDFEKAFSTLAYSELQQKAPGLSKYLIGFQLMKKNDNNDSHAVGIFGFKVGEQWYYAPVFWLNGRLKGFDLLYVVSQDLFVPLQESWVNYITNRKAYVMGKNEPRTPSQLGISSPDFNIFRRSPLMKNASENRVNMLDTLKKMPANYTAGLLKAMEGNTKFAEAVYHFYEPSEILSVVDHVKGQAMFKSAAPKFYVSNPSQEVKIKYDVTSNHDGVDSFTPMTTEQKEKLIQGEPYVEDYRKPETLSEVYENPEYNKVWQNPTEGGLWNVVLDSGKVSKCMVINSPKAIGKTRTKPVFATVIDLESKDMINAPLRAVFAKDHLDMTLWQKTYDGFSDANKLAVGDIAALVSDNKEGTLVFIVKEATKQTNGCMLYKVCPHSQFTSLQETKPEGLSYRNPGRLSSNEYVEYDFDSYDAGHYIKIVPEPARMATVRETLIVGQDRCKAIKLGTAYAGDGYKDKGDFSDWKKEHKLKLASIESIDMAIRNSGMRRLALSKSASGKYIVTTDKTKKEMLFKSAFEHLLKNVRLSEQATKTLLKRASVEKITVLVKTAAPFFNAPGATFDSFYNSPVQVPWENVDKIPSQLADRSALREETLHPVDDRAQSAAVQAANNGQKDIFDVSVLMGLVRNNAADDLISEYVKDVIVGNDRIGRILFLYYWHFDDFVEKYGDSDMMELEDLLRDTFKSTGDLVLFLKKKSVEPDAVATNAVVDL